MLLHDWKIAIVANVINGAINIDLLNRMLDDELESNGSAWSELLDTLNIELMRSHIVYETSEYLNVHGVSIA